MAEPVDEVRSILKELEDNNLEYVYLKNFNYLLDGEKYDEDDIDIIVSQSDYLETERIMRNHGFVPFGHDAVRNFVCRTSPLKWGVHVGGLYFYGSNFLDYQKIIAGAVQKSGIRVPSDTLHAAIILLNTALNQFAAGNEARLSNRKLAQIADLDIDWNELNQIIRPVTGRALKQRFLDTLLEGRELSVRWRLAFLIQTMSVERIVRMIKRPFRRAQVVTFIGPDGVGKSTIIQTLQNRLAENGISSDSVYMGYWSKSLIGLQKVSANKRVRKLSRQASASKAWPLIFFRELLFTADMLLRYTVRIFPRRFRYRYVITDRYFYDMLLNHKRTGVIRLLTHLYPRPSVLIYLYAEPETVFTRKPQHTVSQTRELQKRFQEILNEKFVRQTYTIDTQRPIPEIIDEVLTYIT